MEAATTPRSNDHQAIQREILRRVAEGELTPAEAADLLAELDRQTSPPETSAPPPTPESGPEAAGAGGGEDVSGGEHGSGPTSDKREQPTRDRETAIRVVRINAAFRSVQVIGDPSITEALVTEGPHQVRRAGDALVIDVETEDDFDGYSFSSSAGGRGPAARAARARLWAVGVGQRRLRPVVVRVNPDLEVDAELSAGTLTMLGVRGPVRARVSAGSLRIEGFASPLDIAVSAGSVSARGVLDRGESNIECDAGKVRVALESGSSVRVQARAELGKVDIHGASDDGSSEWLLGGGHDATIGAGAATLKIRTSMGAVQVVAP